MCGIAGMIGFGDLERLEAMTGALAHRGPDGEYFYTAGPVYLGSRRLAIQDPSGGAQPKTNEDGSIVVVYNGEIYNYAALRDRLLSRGHRLDSRCDTELLPHLYEDEGIDFVDRLNGIFAFALWDGRRKSLFLVRDPMGVKPLVYAERDGKLAFGSEAKAVLASRLVSADLDEASLHLTMNVRYIPGERTLFTGIERLPPGGVLKIDDTGSRLSRGAALRWEPRDLSRPEWIEAVQAELEAAVDRQLLSDVPLGVSLSGGVDSTAVVAMIRRRHTGPLKTFTLGFNEPWDENEDARFVADHFATEHHEIVLYEPAMSYLRDAIYFSEEPKVNSLQLYLLHRFVSTHVKVALSGLGGDELFAGYDFYNYLRRSDLLRAAIPHGIAKATLPFLDGTAGLVSDLGRPGLDLFVRKIEWLASIHDHSRHYLLLRNAWDFSQPLLRRVYTREFVERLDIRVRDSFEEYFADRQSINSEALEAEIRTKLVNDLLHNEDTMSMAHSVESRVPFLDLEFVRLASGIPNKIRFRGGPKGLLKDALVGIVPERTLSKRKWGFTVDPVEQFRNKDLRSMAERFLSSERLRRGGIFNPEFVRRIVAARPHQRLRWHYFMLWQMIGLEIWRELFLDGGHLGAAPRVTAAQRRLVRIPPRE